MYVGRLKNYIFVGLLFVTSFLGSLFFLFPLFPFLVWNRSIWRCVVDKIIGLWLCLPVALLEFLHGVRFKVTGDRMCSEEKAVIIMNHRTRLDWMFLWSALYRMDGWLLTTEKIVLKAQLRKVLGAGWAMECDSFIFLERALDRDSAVLTESAQYLSSTERSYQVLIFPEGTDLCPNTLVRSDAYAESKNLPLYRNVLHPKTNGFVHMIKELRKHNAVDYIYDFTIAYPNGIVQTEIDLVKEGMCPSRVDFHCRRYRVDEIIAANRGNGDGDNADEGVPLRRWCERLWQRKELALTRYYGSKNNNNDNKDDELLSLERALADEGVGAAVNAEQPPRAADRINTYELDTISKGVLLICMTWWLVSICFWFYALWSWWWVKYFAALGIAVFKGIEYSYGGIERLEIDLWQKSRPQQTQK